MKKIKIFLPTLLLFASTIFSQTITLNSKADTIIGFTLNQGRFLLNQCDKVKELDTLLKICRVKAMSYQVVIYNDSLSKADLEKINKNCLEITAMKDVQVQGLKEIIRQNNRSLAQQKILKWCGYGLAAVSAYAGFRVGMLAAH